MNILRYELRIKFKVFVFWSIGLILLLVAGGMEFEGVSGANSESVQIAFDYYPPIVLALMGITENVDFTSLLGYAWVIGYYSTLCGSVYAIILGSNVINRELIDKTFEFLFTKPRKRGYILNIKIVAGFVYLTMFSIINYLGLKLIIAPLDEKINYDDMLMISGLSTYIVSLVFYAIAIFISSTIKDYSKGSKLSFMILLFAFFTGAVYDVSPNMKFIQLFTPLRYFNYSDAIDGNINLLYLFFCAILIVTAVIVSHIYFHKRDITEI